MFLVGSLDNHRMRSEVAAALSYPWSRITKQSTVFVSKTMELVWKRSCFLVCSSAFIEWIKDERGKKEERGLVFLS